MRRAPPRPVLALALSAAMLALGCGNDFDALFAGSPVDDAGANPGPSAPKDAAASGPDAACPSGSCGSNQSCSGDRCDHTCGECCSCPAPSLPCTGDSTECGIRCDAKSSCDVACETDDGDCDLDCRGCTAKLTCNDKSSCAIDCKSGGNCEMTCNSSRKCEVTCEAGSVCLLRCMNTGDGCSMTCASGAATRCNGDVFVCGRACP